MHIKVTCNSVIISFMRLFEHRLLKFIIQMSKKIDAHITDKYKIGELIGSGAYGHVWKVEDKITRRHYALKKVFGAFRNNIDAQRTYREVQILQKIHHPNIIRLFKVLGADNKEDLYLVFELMEADLLAVVGSNILTLNHQKYILFQLVKGLKHLHQLQLIHRDLKPSNLLLDSNCNIKICDFGLVRSLATTQQEHPILSEEVATRWYRAPELLLGSRSYSYPADWWSVGCIAAELLTGKPLFEGKSVLEQLEKIIEFTGAVSQEDLESLDSPVVECLVTQIKPKYKPFSEYFSLIDQQFYPFLKGLLKFNPHKRLTVSQILALPLFSDFSEEMGSMDGYNFQAIMPQLDDNRRYNLHDYRKHIYQNIPKQHRAPVEEKVKKNYPIYRKESPKSLPDRRRFSKTIDKVPKKQQDNHRKKVHSKPVDKRTQKRRLSHSLTSHPQRKPLSMSQTNLRRGSSPPGLPYFKELKQMRNNNIVSQPQLHRFEKNLPQIRKGVKKGRKENKFKKC